MTTVYKTSESQRKANKKYADSHKEDMKRILKDYYIKNAERIKKRRMERYYATKQAKALAKLEEMCSKDIDV